MKAKKVLFTAHVDSHILAFHTPYLKYFKDQDYEVHVASHGDAEVPYADVKFNIPIERSPLKLNNLRSIKQLKSIIDRENYDIIHTHTPMGSVVTRIAALRARKRGTRVIYTAHGFHFFKGAPVLNWLVYYPIEKLLAYKTDDLITINQEDYKRAKAKFKTKVHYVPGVGVDPKKFDFKFTKADKTKLRKSLGLKDSDFVMIYVAELSKRKNQTWLVETLKKFFDEHPNAHLLLPGRDSLNGILHKLIEELGLQNKVHLLGFRKDIPQIMRISDIAVSASKQEGLPVNIMEAMYTGLPVVATDCRGNSDLVENGKSGFVVPQGDSRKFLDSILCLYKDKSLGTNISKITKKVCEKYLLNGVMDSMGLLYKKESKIILHLLASNQYSGAENVASEIIRNTDPSHFNSFYVSPSGPINEILDQKNVRHISIKKMSYGELRRIVRSYNPDIIHAHDFRASILASYFSKNVRVISHIHQKPAWLDRSGITSIFYIFQSKRFYKVFVVTDAIAKTRTFRSIRKPDVEVLYNTVDRESIIKKSQLKRVKEYDVIFCGRLEPVKQPLVFLEIINEARKRIPGIKAILVGNGSLYEECMAYIETNGLKDNIDMVGFQANVYPYMSRSKVIAVTSKYEGFGLVVVEAVFLGVRPISYDIAAIRELLCDDEFFVDSSSDMVSAIVNAVRSHDSHVKSPGTLERLLRFDTSRSGSVSTIYGDD